MFEFPAGPGHFHTNASKNGEQEGRRLGCLRDKQQKLSTQIELKVSRGIETIENLKKGFKMKGSKVKLELASLPATSSQEHSWGNRGTTTEHSLENEARMKWHIVTPPENSGINRG